MAPHNVGPRSKVPLKTYSSKKTADQTKNKPNDFKLATIGSTLNTPEPLEIFKPQFTISKEAFNNKVEQTNATTDISSNGDVGLQSKPILNIEPTSAVEFQELLNSISEPVNSNNDFVLDMEVEEFKLSKDAVQLPDEGYSTCSGSLSGKSSPTNSNSDFIHLDTISEELASTNSNSDFINLSNTIGEELPVNDLANHITGKDTVLGFQDIILDSSLMNTDGIAFNLVDDSSNGSSNDQLDKDENDLEWLPEDFTLVGTYKTLPGMMEAFGMEVPKKRTKRHHTKGPKQMDLKSLPEENVKNVMRCREYRKNKKEQMADEEEELEELLARNQELKEEESRIRERLNKMQAAYLRLISEGRVKFC